MEERHFFNEPNDRFTETTLVTASRRLSISFELLSDFEIHDVAEPFIGGHIIY